MSPEPDRPSDIPAVFRSLTRVFVSPDCIAQRRAELDSARAAHLVRVLRMKPGDRVGILDGSGRAWIGVLETAQKTRATAHLEFDVPAPPPLRHVEIAVPLLKGEKMHLVLQKCTEIGASAFHIFPAERSVARLDSDPSAKLKRLDAVVEAAAEQCGAFRLPDVHIWRQLEDFLTRSGPSHRYIAWEGETQIADGGLCGSLDACVLASGPEGGFSEREVSFWRDHGYQSITLGQRILRAETAPIVLAALALCVRFAPSARG